MVSWELPKATINLWRKNNFYDETYLKVAATISSLDGNNAKTIQYQYKATDEANYGPLTTINNSTTYTLSLDNTKAYDFRIIVSDLLGSTTYNLVQQQGLPILFIDRLKRSVGIGAIPTESNQLVADRRLTIKNLAQNIIGDFWSNTEDSSDLYIKNGTTGETLAKIHGGNSGGYLMANHTDGTLRAELYSYNGEGHLWLANANGDYIGGIWADTNG